MSTLTKKKVSKRKPSMGCAEFVAEHEGIKLDAYQDIGGKWTIGYGHTAGVTKGDRITKHEALLFLASDLEAAAVYVRRGLITQVKEIELNRNQFDALVSFTFNVGASAFLSSTLRKMILAHPSNLHIASEMLKWHHVKKQGILGLLRRRLDEATLYFE